MRKRKRSAWLEVEEELDAGHGSNVNRDTESRSSSSHPGEQETDANQSKAPTAKQSASVANQTESAGRQILNINTNSVWGDALGFGGLVDTGTGSLYPISNGVPCAEDDLAAHGPIVLQHKIQANQFNNLALLLKGSAD